MVISNIMIVINARFLTQRITGVQRYASEISKHLKVLNHRLKFLSPKNMLHLNLAEFLQSEAPGLFLGHLWEQVWLPCYLRKNGTPLLLNLANTAPLLYNNQIVTIHDISFLRNPEWFSIRFYYYYSFLLPRIARHSLKVITVSEFSKNEIMCMLKVPKDRVKVIYNGVSEEFTKKGKEMFQNNFNRNYILGVASLDIRKNLERVISAYKKIDLGNVKLVMVGGQSRVFRDKRVNDLMASAEGIIYRGYVSDEELAYLYRNAKLLIYPSLYEGFGLPPLEAMACGCPVVVSNAASLPEICGDAAYYVDPFSVESIAEGMYKVLTDRSLSESLIHKGLKRAKLFSWERAAKAHIELFKEIIGNGGVSE
jgi:glycosyltransferase involved in cell wall biosynthesis